MLASFLSCFKRLFVLPLLFSSTLIYSQFQNSGNSFTGIWDGNSIFVDLDNDNDLDLLVSGTETGLQLATRIYSNNGSGVYTQVAGVLPGIDDGNLEVGDINNDGLLDILIVGAVTPQGKGTLLYINKGALTFEKATHNLPALLYGQIRFGDFDNDGDADALVAGSDLSDKFHDIYRNDGGTFTALNKKFPAFPVPSITWYDYDVDGDLDYIFSGVENGFVTLYKNAGNEDFIPLALDQPTLRESHITAGDYNNDGLPDLLLMGEENTTGKNVFMIFTNLGNESFSKNPSAFTGIYSGNAVFADLDNDGDLDIVATGYLESGNNQFSTAYLNNSGTFLQEQFNFPQLYFSHVAVGDIDNDNDLDIMFTGGSGSSFITANAQLFSNTSASKNSAPSSPVNLTATADGQKVKLQWLSSSDQQTPVAGLTYNVYVRNGASTIVPASTNTLTGYRKIVGPGNTGQAQYFILDNLLPGTYAWSVQSIDNNFAGSAFAQEVVFTVTASPPAIESFQPTSATEGSEIVISGKNFIGVTEVLINGAAALHRIVNSTTLVATVPAGENTGKISVKNSTGTTLSSALFCIIPKVAAIDGQNYICPGTYEYSVVPKAGVNYQWSASEFAEIIEESNNKITIKWNAGGEYMVNVTPQSCMTGATTDRTIHVYGPERINVTGNFEPKTDTREDYFAPDEYGLKYNWVLSSGGSAPESITYYQSIKWQQPGKHTLTLKRSNAECPTSPAINVLDIDVSLNDFSSYDTLSFYYSSTTVNADFNGDSRPEILAGNGYFYVLDNNNKLVAKSDVTFPTSTALAVLDFDRDNDADVLSLASNKITLYENTGDFTFVSVWNSGSTPYYNGSIGVFDFDLDGDVDFFVTAENFLQVFKNNGDKTFSKSFYSAEFVQLLYSGSTQVADINKDGYSDILTSRGVAFINDQNNGFQIERDLLKSVYQSSAPYSANQISIVWIDLNNDGDFGFVENLEFRTAVYEKKAGQYSKIFTAGAGYNRPSTAFADLNNDGYQDFVVNQSGGGELLVAYFDPASDGFTSSTIVEEIYGGNIRFIDLNNDRSLDIVLPFASNVLFNATVFLNNNASANIPSTPVSLTNRIEGSSVKLQWSESSNFRFNVAVGTASGGTDVVSPLSQIASGQRLAYCTNAGIQNELILTLKPGTYYWAVQAVAQNETASPFSEWKSFTIGESVPVAPTMESLTLQSQGIRINWLDNSADETGFVIERSTGDSKDFIPIMEVSSNETSFLDVTIEPGTQYYYRMYALKAANKSHLSNVKSSSLAIVSKFTYKESFEVDQSLWTSVPQEEMNKFRNIYYNTPNQWIRENFYFPKDEKYSVNLWGKNNYESSAALISPYIDLSQAGSPIFSFYTKLYFNYSPGEDAGIRVYISSDDVAWTRMSIMQAFDYSWFQNRIDLTPWKGKTIRIVVSAGLPSGRNAAIMLDDFRVIDPPGEPTDLQVTQLDLTSLTLNWTGTGSGTHFIVERNTDGGSFVPLDTINYTTPNYRDVNVATGHLYAYRVAVYDKVEQISSGYTNTVEKFLLTVKHNIADQTMNVFETILVPAELVSQLELPDIQYEVFSLDETIVENNDLSVTKTSTGATITVTAGNYSGSVVIGLKGTSGQYISIDYFLLNINDSRIPQTIDSFAEIPDAEVGQPDFTLNATATSGLPVTFTSSNPGVISISDNIATVVAAGTTIITAHQEGNTEFAPAASIAQEVTVRDKSEQHFTEYDPTIMKAFDDPSFQLNAHVSSGLQVVYSSDNPSVASVNGNVVIIHDVGSAIITAAQPGNDEFHPAPSVTITITVVKASQTIDFPPLAEMMIGEMFELNATASSGLTVHYLTDDGEVATNIDKYLTALGAGTCIVTAIQNGNNHYEAALEVPQILIVSKVPQTITSFEEIPDAEVGQPDIALNATTSSGLPVTFTSSNPGVISISGYIATIVAAGTAIITAHQEGNAEFARAESVPQNVIVRDKSEQHFTDYTSTITKAFGDPSFELSTMLSSGLQAIYSSDNPSVATVNGNLVIMHDVGSAVITAAQPGNDQFYPAPSVTITITVVKASQTIDFPALDQMLIGETVELNATASSGLTITYLIDNGDVATNIDQILSAVGAGSCIVTAVQNGNDRYEAAVHVQQILIVQKLPQTITFDALPDKTAGDTPFVLNATASSGLPVSYSSSDESIATITGNEVQIFTAGKVIITGSQPGNEVFEPAASVSQELFISTVVGIEPKPSETKLYPDPVVAFATLAFGNPTSRNMTIFIINGQGTLARTFIVSAEREVQLDLQDLQPGVYVMQMNIEGKLYQERFVKE